MASLLRWILAVAVAAALGALASRDAASFYAQLALPPWAPPAWVFGPAWTVLYGLMAIAAWRVERSGRGTSAMVALFLAQLAVNALWSWLFFGWKRGGDALLDIVVLDVLVLATMAAFRRADGKAAVLLLPYLAWIAFATALNWAVWRANPGLLQ